jgi:hypothetical protein
MLPIVPMSKKNLISRLALGKTGSPHIHFNPDFGRRAPPEGHETAPSDPYLDCRVD